MGLTSNVYVTKKYMWLLQTFMNLASDVYASNNVITVMGLTSNEYVKNNTDCYCRHLWN